MITFHVMKIVRVNLDGKRPTHARTLDLAVYMPTGEFSFVLFRGLWLILVAFRCMA